MKPLLLFIAVASSLCATPEFSHRLLRTGTYMGDSKGRYQGDKLLIFADGSHWKVHPHDQSKCFLWQSSDTLTIHKRTVLYRGRWEHPFTIVNVSLDESIRAMPIQHADNPVTVTDIRSSDHYGYKVVALSDGAEYELLFNRYPFMTGEKVYVVQQEEGFWNYLLIVDIDGKSQGIEAHLRHL